VPIILEDPPGRPPGGIVVSVVIPARNEYPQILGTIHSVTDELEYWGYPHEVIVVSNQSTDHTPDVLENRYRHWIKEGRLKVVRFDERPACWHARNVGVGVARGKVLVICDAHVSVRPGTLHGIIQNWSEHGGLWFSASQMWGDPSHTRLYGYRMQIEEKFWGALSRYIPPEATVNGELRPYTVPMAQFSLFVLDREDFLSARGFHPGFRCYGGGEPYFALKWWMLGKKAWMYSQGLVRHAFGLKIRWKKVADPERTRGKFVKGKGIVELPEVGDEFLANGRDYAWNNDQLWFNFLLAAYTIGGEEWLERRRRRYVEQCKGVERYLENLERLVKDVRLEGLNDRDWIEAHSMVSLDQLLEREPWNDFAMEMQRSGRATCEEC
jgi:glycosyltransferase involved in cell wall biosynthesis